MSLASRRPSFTTYQELSEYRNLFSCLICLEMFTNPRILDCSHIFCEHCLRSYHALFAKSTDSDCVESAVMCPTCRKLTPTSVGVPAPVSIPDCKAASSARHRKVSRNGDAMLQCDGCFFRSRHEVADFHCSKCAMNFCKSCRLLHDQHALFKGHFVMHVSNKETLELFCDVHSKMASVYFCLECNVPVCVVCILYDHGTHNTTKLRDALATRRDNLKTLLNELGPRLDKLESAIKTLDSLYASDAVSSTVDTWTKPERKYAVTAPPGYLSTVGARKDQLFQTNGLTRSKSSPSYLPPAYESIAHRIENKLVESSNENVTEKPEIQAVAETERLLNKKDGHLKTCDHSGKESSSCRNSLNSKRGLRFISRLRNNCESPSSQRKPGLPAGSGSPDIPIRDGRFQAVFVQVSRHRKLFNLSTKMLEMSQSKKLFAIYEDMVDRIKTVLEVDSKQLQEELNERIAFETTRKLARLADSDSSLTDSTKSNGTAVKNGVLVGSSGGENQMSMLVRPKLRWKIEKQRSDLGEMWNPCDVTFLSEDSVVVAEYDSVTERNNKLQVFDATGQSLGVLAQGQIRPLGVAVTREGNIAVTDCRGKRVKIITQTGQTVADIGKGHFGWPYGIAVNSRGQLIITDAFNDTVSIFQADGKRIRMFGSTGSQPSHFRNPYHVTVDARDNIFVSDSGNNAIKVFDPSGKFLFLATDAMRRPSVDLPGERRVKRKTLKGPRGIAVDPTGNILVADDCCRVCMFDSNGKYVRNLLTDEDSVKYPEAVRCNPRGLLAVTEWNPNNMFAIKVFTMYE